MLNDPEFDKMIIYGLAGVCLVLLLAVIYLAVKRNTYYVDERGREVPSPKRPFRVFPEERKPARTIQIQEEPEEEYEPEPEPEPEVITEPAGERKSIKDFADKLLKKVARPAKEPVAEPVAVQEPEIQAVIEPEVSSFEEPEDYSDEEEDVTKVMRFTIDPEPEPAAEEPVIEEPVIEEPEPEPLTVMSFDAEPEEDDDDIFAEEPPAPVIVKPSGLTVTVTVGGQSETHEIDTLPCLIGREQTSCNLVISEPAVSRRHARIYVNEDGLFIEDVSEHNGTYVNGTKLPSLGSAPLKEDDRISLGRAEISVNRILY